MKTYSPDLWTLVKIESGEFGTHYKILASWYGGFAGSESWKLSSGCVKASIDDTSYCVLQHTGSSYLCYNNNYGMSSYAASIFKGWEKDSIEGGFTITQLNKKDAVEWLKSISIV